MDVPRPQELWRLHKGGSTTFCVVMGAQGRYTVRVVGDYDLTLVSEFHMRYVDALKRADSLRETFIAGGWTGERRQ